MMNNLMTMSFEQVLIFGMIIVVNLFILVDRKISIHN